MPELLLTLTTISLLDSMSALPMALIPLAIIILPGFIIISCSSMAQKNPDNRPMTSFNDYL